MRSRYGNARRARPGAMKRHTRANGGEEAYNKGKAHLPAITFGGTFAPSRKIEHLTQHSGIVHGDLDHLDDLGSVKSRLAADPYVVYCFVSPSDTGLKTGALIEPVADDAAYKHTWQAVADYYRDRYGLTWDPTGKDICRLCYVSWDTVAHARDGHVDWQSLMVPIISLVQEGPPQAEGTRPPTTERDRWPVLDRSKAMHGLAGIVTIAIDPYTEADPVAVLLNVLTAFGNIIGPKAHFRVEHTRHALRLFVCLVGQTSKGRKGTSWSTPAYIFRCIEEAWAAYRVSSGLSSGEGLIHHVRDERWEALYDELSEGQPGLFGAITARAEVQIMRLAAIYAALDGTALIQVPHLQAALAVWRYCEASARLIFGDSTGDPVADRILKTLQEQGPMDRTGLRDLFGRHMPAEKIDRALSLLEQSHRIECDEIKNPKGGRPLAVVKLRERA